MSNHGLPGDEGRTRATLLALLEASGRRGRRLRELVRALSSDADEETVGGALNELEAAGEAFEVDGQWRHVRFADGVVGEVDLLRSGDALIRTGSRGEAGYFVPRDRLEGGRDRDTVLIAPETVGKRRRPKAGRLPEARVRRVLHRRVERLVGSLEKGDDGRQWLRPFDPKLELDVEVEGAKGHAEETFVVVELTGQLPGASRVKARMVEALGHPDEPGVDSLAVLRHFEIPDAFPPDVAAASSSLPADPAPPEWMEREDLRGTTTLTIDGETAKDFDDALSINRLPSGRYLLGVHIADVAHYVPEGSRLDEEAYRRGTSVYFPERAVPMLPEELSTRLCSLRPGQPRLTVSAFLEITASGEVVGRRFAETVIQSARRMTYSEVRRLLEEPSPGDRSEYGELLDRLGEMRALMKALRRRRVARGSLDFDLPEGNVIVDPAGYTIGIRPGERNVAHRIVEEFMIAANEAVAWELVAADCPALFRVHEPPTRERIEQLREVLRPLGLTIKEDMEDLHPQALQRLLAQVEGKPEEPFVSNVVLRSLQRAIYSPECRGHYALASRHYTHFTSPIRRYPDLVVHRRLKSYLRREDEMEAERTQLRERLPGIAERASWTERRAEQCERELLQWKKVRFLAQRVGERFRGLITGVQPFGLFVELDQLFVDGLVPVRTLSDDFYLYDPANHRLVGQRRERVFRLADSVEVTLVGVDLRHRGLDLRIVGMPEAAERRRDRQWASRR